MKHIVARLLLVLPFLVACKSVPDYAKALPDGSAALLPLGWRDRAPDFSREWERREEILPALELSITWLRRQHAQRFFPAAGISHERTLRSLERFRELLLSSYGPEEFQERIADEFTIYKSAGWNGRGGGVLFTAYCTPIIRGSLEPDPTYRFPLYALPPDLVKAADGTTLGWETSVGRMPSYPSRRVIEATGLLEGKGLELVWLADPIDAFIAHVNGSAFIELADGSMLRLGYAGKNGRPYSSLGRALEASGKIPKGQVSLRAIREWAAVTPEEEVLSFLHGNASYVFFTPIDGNPHGSLDVEVTAGRSVATDKTIFPRAALVFVEAEAPAAGDSFARFMFDQDTGGAIRTAGRADLYLGVGPEAEERAGRIKLEGQLYYLFLKESAIFRE